MTFFNITNYQRDKINREIERRFSEYLMKNPAASITERLDNRLMIGELVRSEAMRGILKVYPAINYN